MKPFLAISLVALILIAGCNNPTGNAVLEGTQHFANETLPLEVAKLGLLNLESVDTFEKYKSFVDRINDLIKILNEQSDMFNIEPFNPTLDGWQKASKYITEYGPLINNYNEVVRAAKDFEGNKNEDTRKHFYLASGKFAFETAIIVGAVFYTASYEAVGIAYRSVGFNTFALKCGSCVSVVLSQAHWTVRTVLVEGTSQGAQLVIDAVEKAQESGVIDQAKNITQEILWSGKNTLDRFVDEVTQ